MTFEEALKAMKCGKIVKRPIQGDETYSAYHAIGLVDNELYWFDKNLEIDCPAELTGISLIACDWEICGETKKHKLVDITLSGCKSIRCTSSEDIISGIEFVIKALNENSCNENKHSEDTAVDTLLRFNHNIEIGKNTEGEFYAKYTDCGVKDGCVLCFAYGTGDTIEKACAEYLNRIKGRILVFNAYSKYRKEEKFPVL